MARHGDYLYRRNGTFYARVRVPQPLLTVYARSDLRKSLDTTNYALARLRVLEAVLLWKRDFLRIQTMLDARQAVAGSAVLLGDGLISLDSAARECGLRLDTMIREAINRGANLRLDCSGRIGYPIEAKELVHDFDGSVILNSAIDHQNPTPIVGPLFLRRNSLAQVSGELFEDCLFFKDCTRTHAVVFDLPGISVPVGSLLITAKRAESIRASLAANITPAMLELASSHASPNQTASTPQHKHGTMRASALMTAYYKTKSAEWAPSSAQEAKSKCGVFIELMNDPTLSEIDGVMMLDYRARLRTLPADLYQTKRKLKTNVLAELISLAATGGLPLMTDARADAYVAKAGEAFNWGHVKGYLPNNPAAGAIERKKKTKRAQDDRQEFSAENLRLIFSAPWFLTGKGEKTSKGTYQDFQPFYFWLPLMALHTGARLTELSQLYLADIKKTESGTWYFDFNLNGADKVSEPDKRLKNVNSERQVPLHAELIRIGLPAYAEALAAAGHTRLFPELRHDNIKGYGKASGSWFNERFMGNQLKVPRDGMQTFHSFRHGFITAMNDLEPSLSEFTINQLSGHERGETMSRQRYAKDAKPDVLRPHVDRLTFNIPAIAVFDSGEGVDAIKDALKRKERAARGKKANV